MPPRYLPLLCLGLLATPALAESVPRPDPVNAAAPTAPLDYRSSFEGYQRYEAQTPAPWRASNQAVGAPAGRAVETAPTTPPAGGHTGHKR